MYERAVFYCVVDSGVHSCWDVKYVFPCKCHIFHARLWWRTLYTLEVLHIIHLIILSGLLCDCTWLWVDTWTCKGEYVCNVKILLEDWSGQLLYGTQDTWDFCLHEVWSWGQQVSCLILCPPYHFFYKDEDNIERWLGSQDACIGVLSCLSIIFLFSPDCPNITLMEVLWGN